MMSAYTQTQTQVNKRAPQFKLPGLITAQTSRLLKQVRVFDLRTFGTYLESHVRFLTTGDVLARAGDDDNRNVVVVTSEEPLGAGHNVADNDRRAQGEDDVLIVGVQHAATVHLA